MKTEIEPSVHMRLYSLNKRQFVCVFIVFILCIGITILIGAVGPPITEIQYKTASKLPIPPASMQTGPFYLKSPVVSTFNQQLWLIAKVLVQDIPPDHKIFVRFDVAVRVIGLSSHHKSDVLYGAQNSTLANSHNRSRELRCTGQSCDTVILMHLGYLDYPQYYLDIQYYGLSKSELADHINDTIFSFHSYNPAFTQTEIWFRFVFIILTFICTVWFIHSMRRFSLRDWGMEQRWVSFLLILLLLYNNPLFPMTFLINSWIPGLIDAIFQATFLSGLLLFWLCLYHGFRQNDRRFCRFYLPKILLVGLIWISVITLASWQAYNEIQDPTYNYKLDTGNFTGFKIFLFVIGGLYLLYLVFLIVRAYAELRNIPYFDLRLKFMSALVVIVVIVSCFILVVRFGSGVLQDNFVAEISTHYHNSVEFLSFYGLLNLYLFTMAFVYSPSKNADKESHFRDNPTISMLNDSDDDVVYGSDEEMTTLTTRTANRYDSDT